MAKKHWIYIKRGLSEDPKHRAAMGECIWLYMHIIDRADWETGIAFDWKDTQEAAEMSMPVDTLRRQRQKLQELDYIKTKQKQHSQDVYILEWRNPRDYGCEIKNPRSEGLNPSIPSNDEGLNQGLNEGLNQVDTQVKTPSSDSKSDSNLTDIIQEANKKMDAYLQLANAPGMKRETRLDSILSYIGGKLHISATSKRWKDFAKFVDNQQREHGQSIEMFISWLMAQKNFDVQYWSPARMQEFWPQAFIRSNSIPEKPITEQPDQDWRKGINL